MIGLDTTCAAFGLPAFARLERIVRQDFREVRRPQRSAGDAEQGWNLWVWKGVMRSLHWVLGQDAALGGKAKKHRFRSQAFQFYPECFFYAAVPEVSILLNLKDEEDAAHPDGRRLSMTHGLDVTEEAYGAEVLRVLATAWTEERRGSATEREST